MNLNNNDTSFHFLMRLFVLTVILAFSSQGLLHSQKTRETPPPFKERLFIGGNVGLQFGTITDIQVSPVIGLWVLPRLAVALGPDYRYFKYRDEHTNIYGGKTYLQFVIVKDVNSVIPVGVHTGIFLHIEDELLSLESAYWKYPPFNSERFYINTVLAGGGISQQIGRRSSLNIMILWALNDSGYDVYSNPEFRVSFNF